MNADQNKPFCYRRSSAFIGGSLFFAPPTRDSVLTGARPGRSEQVSQSDSSAASTHWVDLRRSESSLGTLGFLAPETFPAGTVPRSSLTAVVGDIAEIHEIEAPYAVLEIAAAQLAFGRTATCLVLALDQVFVTDLQVNHDTSQRLQVPQSPSRALFCSRSHWTSGIYFLVRGGAGRKRE